MFEPTEEMIERGLAAQERVAIAQERMAASQEFRTEMLNNLFQMFKPALQSLIKEFAEDEKDRRNKKSK